MLNHRPTADDVHALIRALRDAGYTPDGDTVINVPASVRAALGILGIGEPVTRTGPGWRIVPETWGSENYGGRLVCGFYVRHRLDGVEDATAIVTTGAGMVRGMVVLPAVKS